MLLAPDHLEAFLQDALPGPPGAEGPQRAPQSPHRGPLSPRRVQRRGDRRLLRFLAGLFWSWRVEQRREDDMVDPGCPDISCSSFIPELLDIGSPTQLLIRGSFGLNRSVFTMLVEMLEMLEMSSSLALG